MKLKAAKMNKHIVKILFSLIFVIADFSPMYAQERIAYGIEVSLQLSPRISDRVGADL